VLSPLAARLAEKWGYKNVKVFHAGAPAWQQGGHPLITTQKFLAPRLENVVLIDTRGPEEAKKGHITGAFAIALDKVLAAKDQLPLDTSVPVILYAQDTDLKEIEPVVAELAAWVDNQIFVLKGGFSGWQKSGGAVASGKIRTQIVYLPRPGPGEVMGDEFMNIVKGEPEDKVILDVRNPDEWAEGHVKWATKITLDDLPAKLAELPKEKEIIVHCGSGMRASVAHNVLKKAGYKSRYLNNTFGILDKQPICCYKD
jgi:rhodanese-related sulfurtransferase